MVALCVVLLGVAFQQGYARTFKGEEFTMVVGLWGGREVVEKLFGPLLVVEREVSIMVANPPLYG